VNTSESAIKPRNWEQAKDAERLDEKLDRGRSEHFSIVQRGQSAHRGKAGT